MVLRGGTNVVEAGPVRDEIVEDWTLLVMDPIVLVEPVGDRGGPARDRHGMIQCFPGTLRAFRMQKKPEK